MLLAQGIGFMHCLDRSESVASVIKHYDGDLKMFLRENHPAVRENVSHMLSIRLQSHEYYASNIRRIIRKLTALAPRF